MFNWFKKCDHDWKEFKVSALNTGMGMVLNVDLYCPKCDKTKNMTKNEWDYERKLKEMRSQYNK